MSVSERIRALHEAMRASGCSAEEIEDVADALQRLLDGAQDAPQDARRGSASAKPLEDLWRKAPSWSAIGREALGCVFVAGVLAFGGLYLFALFH